MKHFSEDGLSFSYPDDWRIEREPIDNGWSVVVQSPGTGFAQIWLDRDMPTTEAMATTALEALQEDYPNLEAESAIEMLAGEMAIGHDFQFISLDLIITCWTRSFYSVAGTVLVLCQFDDLDHETCEPALRGICASLQSDTE